MKLATIIILTIMFLIAGYYFQQHILVFIAMIKQIGWLGPFFFLIIYCLATVLLLPTMVLTLAGGALFGPINGILLNLIGATLGAISAFCISRYIANDWLIAKRNKKLNTLIAGVEKRGWQFVALLRLIPIVPFNLVNYGLGITRIKLSHYVMATMIFLVPCEAIYTYCGYVGMDLLTHHQPFYKWVGLSMVLIIGIWLILLKWLEHSQKALLINS